MPLVVVRVVGVMGMVRRLGVVPALFQRRLRVGRPLGSGAPVLGRGRVHGILGTRSAWKREREERGRKPLSIRCKQGTNRGPIRDPWEDSTYRSAWKPCPELWPPRSDSPTSSSSSSLLSSGSACSSRGRARCSCSCGAGSSWASYPDRICRSASSRTARASSPVALAATKLRTRRPGEGSRFRSVEGRC